LAPAPRSPQWNRSNHRLLRRRLLQRRGVADRDNRAGKQIYDLTHADLNLGLLGLAGVRSFGVPRSRDGTISDRFERARICAMSAGVEVLAGAGLAAYALTRPRSVGPIFALVLLFGAGRAFFNPASRALPADIVTAEELPWLTSRRAATWQSATILGPVIGGALYVVDRAAPYIAMAVLSAFAALAMSLVRAGGPKRVKTSERPGLREALGGLRYIRESPILLAAISLDLFAVLFGGAVRVVTAIATDRLGVGAVGLGWLRAPAASVPRS